MWSQSLTVVFVVYLKFEYKIKPMLPHSMDCLLCVHFYINVIMMERGDSKQEKETTEIVCPSYFSAALCNIV